MQIIKGNISGPLAIEVDTKLRGNVFGDVTVRPGRLLRVQGNMLGDVILEGDATAEVQGNLTGVVRRAAEENRL